MKICTELSAAAAVVSGMQRHPQSAEVQQRGSGAIFSLTWTDHEAQTAAAEAGAVKQVMTAMSLHLCAAGVQEYGAMALMSLIAAHDRNMQEVCSSGALTQVLQTMRAQRDNSSVLDACVRMLLNLVLKKSDARI